MRHFELPGKNAVLQPPLENFQINHVQHTLYQVLKHGDDPSDCESSCFCYYCYIEGLGLHAVYTARYVIRINKRLRNRIKIERQ